jgi:hypothetical protein
MLGPFPLSANEALTCFQLWPERKLLPAPEEGLDTEPIPITPNRLANVFRAVKKKNREKNKRARKSRAKNR